MVGLLCGSNVLALPPHDVSKSHPAENKGKIMLPNAELKMRLCSNILKNLRQRVLDPINGITREKVLGLGESILKQVDFEGLVAINRQCRRLDGRR
jgi:hypothetical protein